MTQSTQPPPTQPPAQAAEAVVGIRTEGTMEALLAVRDNLMFRLGAAELRAQELERRNQDLERENEHMRGLLSQYQAEAGQAKPEATS